MPELPEVETIVQQLKKKVKGKTIEKIDILDSKVASPTIKKAIGCKIDEIYRRGKSIVFVLDKGNLLFHLRMTGHFHYNEEKFKQFVVAKFHFKDGFLTHNSIRKFGHIKFMDNKELERELIKLGVEPLSKEFSLEKFNEILLKKSKSNIKVMLLDQSLIAGVGNIYAQEALYHAGIDPRRKVSSLSSSEIKKLHHGLIRVLRLAVSKRGTTVENYVHIEGSGGFQSSLAVYGKGKCPKGHSLKKVVIGSRGTSYCGVCQR